MRHKYHHIISVIRQMNIAVVCMAFLIFQAALLTASVRLKLIIEAQEIKILLPEAISLTFIGYFFNNFLPTAIGGDVVKAYYLSKRANNKIGSFASIFVDRTIGLITMIFMATLTIFFIRGEAIDARIKYVIYGITVLASFVIILAMNRNFAKLFSVFLFFVKPLEDKLRRAYDVVHTYKHHKNLMLRSFAISVLSQLLFFTTLSTLAFSIGSHIPIIELLLRVPLISVLSLLPSINGLGLREGATVLLFGPLIGSENAFAVSILMLFILFATSLMGGVIYGLSPQFRVRLKEIG